MKKNQFILILIFIYLFVIAGSLFSMPPHPDLLEEMRRQGKMPQLTAGLNLMQEKGMNTPPLNAVPTTGPIRALVILISYSNTAMDASSDIAFYENIINGTGALTTQQYYLDMSDDQLSLTCDIVGPYTADETLAHYGNNVGGIQANDAFPAELVGEAIDLAEINGVDFSPYDNDGDGEVEMIIIIHAGRGEETGAAPETIWSHKWDLNSSGEGERIYDAKTINTYTIQPEYVFTVGDSTIGVLTHELGHIFGLPDLYDTSNATYGVGDWSLMASGSWNGPAGKGSVPAPMLAWERDKLGWITLDTLVASNSANPDADYQYASFTILGIVLLLSIFLTLIFGRKKGIKSIIMFLLPVLLVCLIPVSFINCSDGGGGAGDTSITNIDTSFAAQKIPLGFSYSGGEQYYILENKVSTAGTWSQYLPGQGLLITHIDEYILYYFGGSGTYNSNTVNSLTGVHGVNIIEADGDNALWAKWNQGSPTDLFYSSNNSYFTSNTNPYTYYNNWVGPSSYTIVRSTVSITDISAPGNTMTFNYNY